jgi:hypothetical protein
VDELVEVLWQFMRRAQAGLNLTDARHQFFRTSGKAHRRLEKKAKIYLAEASEAIEKKVASPAKVQLWGLIRPVERAVRSNSTKSFHTGTAPRG